MQESEKELQEESMRRIRWAVGCHGAHKKLAVELQMSDSDLSRLLNVKMPELCRLLSHLGLVVLPEDHVRKLRDVLKEVL